jgi:hypothetical protein
MWPDRRSSRPRARIHQVPVGAALALFAGLYVSTTIWLLHLTGGHLTYALDDAYIHMAIAKNVALHGVWGVQPDQFAAASSSPLWTALLAVVFKVVGIRDIVPLALNTVFAVILIVVLGRLLHREQVCGLPMFAVLVSALLSAPLVPMVWIGMEHTMHILLTIVAAWATSSVASHYSTRRLAGVCAVAALMVGARYEGLFVVAGCAVVFALARRPIAAVAVIAAGSLPVLVVGFWNMSHGWFFLPASILMKQTVLRPGSGRLLSSMVSNLALASPPAALVVLVIAALALLAYQSRVGVHAIQPLLTIFTIAALLHLALARFGWLFRYESYLMVLGSVAVGISALHCDPPGVVARRVALTRSDFVAIAAIVGVLTFSQRTIASHALTASVAGHVFRQHRQVAAFLERYYHAAPVAVNDIGVVSYFAGARTFDLMGLGSLQVATLRRAGLWDVAHINELLSRREVGIAIIYDTWFQDGQAFQQSWARVGEWTTDHEDVRGEGTVTFFARNEHDRQRLTAALHDFNQRFRAPGVDTRIFTAAVVPELEP